MSPNERGDELAGVLREAGGVLELLDERVELRRDIGGVLVAENTSVNRRWDIRASSGAVGGELFM